MELYRSPTATDGLAVNQMVSASPPLDPNSVYCNILQCAHFANTSILCENDGVPVGFISGYRLPDDPHVLFIWQVMVTEKGRGRGVATNMVLALLYRLRPHIHFVHSTVTPNNTASDRLFRSLAARLGTDLATHSYLNRERHFGGMHDSESLYQIGPIRQKHIEAAYTKIPIISTNNGES